MPSVYLIPTSYFQTSFIVSQKKKIDNAVIRYIIKFMKHTNNTNPNRKTIPVSEQKENTANRPLPQYTETERLALEKRYRTAAKEYIPKRVAYYVSHYDTLFTNRYSRITIRDQKTRWGSCSSKGTLSFNWRLMLAPPAVLDYVVVHELCHLTHMNHSKDFWRCVEWILPNYKEQKKWLKEHGHELTLS